MPFFTEIAQIMADGNVTMTLHKDGKRLVAMVVFKNDEGKMPPFTAEGTPKELETQLIPEVRAWAKDLRRFRTNLVQARKILKSKEKQARKQATKDAGRVTKKRTPAASSQPSLTG